jgi:hypothetical protein
MATIVRFAPEHERRLRQLCIKKQFLKNIASTGMDVEVFALQSIELGWDWKELICMAFMWKDSPEGFTYWEGIAGIKTQK